MKRKTVRTLVAFLLVASSVGAQGQADQARTENRTELLQEYPFDARIDTWVQGTIVTLDAEGKKLGIRGRRLPYASEYASMMKEVNDRLKKEESADPSTVVANVQREWQEKLDKARAEPIGEEQDYNLNIPESRLLSIRQEREVRDLPFLKDVLASSASSSPEADSPSASGAVSAAPGEIAEPSTATADQTPGATTGTGTTPPVARTDDAEVSPARIENLQQMVIGQPVIVGLDDGFIWSEVYSVIQRGQVSAAVEPIQSTN